MHRITTLKHLILLNYCLSSSFGISRLFSHCLSLWRISTDTQQNIATHQWRSWKVFVKWNKGQPAALKWFLTDLDLFQARFCFGFLTFVDVSSAAVTFFDASTLELLRSCSSAYSSKGNRAASSPQFTWNGGWVVWVSRDHSYQACSEDLLVTFDPGWAFAITLYHLHTMELSQGQCLISSRESPVMLSGNPAIAFL